MQFTQRARVVDEEHRCNCVLGLTGTADVDCATENNLPVTRASGEHQQVAPIIQECYPCLCLITAKCSQLCRGASKGGVCFVISASVAVGIGNIHEQLQILASRLKWQPV